MIPCDFDHLYIKTFKDRTPAQWGKPYGVDGISVFMRMDEPFVFKLSGYGL